MVESNDVMLKHIIILMFQNLGGVLVAMIGEAIGDTDPELLELWKSSLTAIMNVVMAGCF